MSNGFRLFGSKKYTQSYLAADALSRVDHATLATLNTSQCTPVWLQEVIQGYQDDPQSLDILAKLAIKESDVPDFTLKDGLLRYKGKVWIGNNKLLQLKIISTIHDTAIGGHSGIPVTYQKLKNLFAWQFMKTTVHTYVKSCSICQQAKPERNKYPGLL